MLKKDETSQMEHYQEKSLYRDISNSTSGTEPAILKQSLTPIEVTSTFPNSRSQSQEHYTFHYSPKNEEQIRTLPVESQYRDRRNSSPEILTLLDVMC